MKIDLVQIPISEITAGYIDNAEEGVIGYSGRLNIRPAFQREFIYKENQRNEVIKSIISGYPINIMYWVKNDDGNFELLDGQQRTVSICQYVHGDYSLDYLYFHNLSKEKKKIILDYKLMIYICEGTSDEKIAWYEIINIAGEKLTDQELLNAMFIGEWLSEAKMYFSKTGCPAYQIAEEYLKGSAIRQEYLETAIKWLAAKEGKGIKPYMADHQKDPNANELWLYFQAVINWVKAIFPKYRKEMKGLEWGFLYNKYSNGKYDSKGLEKRITELMEDEDITKPSGIYEYLFDGDERHLNIRAFTERMKRIAYERQKGICPGKYCGGKHFEINEMEADHITPWSKGGKTNSENCQMLCKECNRRKSGI